MNPFPHVLAYIDPGSGAMLYQILVAGGLGMLFAFKRLREKILGIFSRKKDNESDTK